MELRELDPVVRGGTMRVARYAIVIMALCIGVAVGASGALLVHHDYYIRIPDRRVQDDVLDYKLDDSRRLIVGPDVALLINVQERVVVSLPPFAGQRLGSVVFWPRDRTKGVILGDGVKGNDEDYYLFRDSQVDIRFATAATTYVLRVPLCDGLGCGSGALAEANEK